MILIKNSIHLSLLLFCERDLVLSFDDVAFSTGGFLDFWNVILLESKNLYFSKYLSSLLFCKRDLGFVFVSLKRGFLDYKNVILLESKNLHFSTGDKLFSDFYWGEGGCTHMLHQIQSPCVSVYFVKTTPLKFYPISFFFFFCRSQRQSRRKVEGLCYTCTHLGLEQGDRALWTIWDPGN